MQGSGIQVVASDLHGAVRAGDSGKPRQSLIEHTPVDVFITQCSIHLCRAPLLGGKEAGEVVRTLVKDVSLTVRSGELFAIMGGSGSGKTTLLNVIAGRYKASQLRVDGAVVFRSSQGAMTYQQQDVVGYVTQSDHLMPFLTVRETLSYGAALKMPAASSPAQRAAAVEHVVLDLGLKDCGHTVVGDEHVRGISGGEKRRVSVGLQILTDPPVLTLDEPTSGLDAFTACNLVDTLARLAHERGKTVIASIHQPRGDVFLRFDSALLLSHGRPTYCGKVSEMEDYLGGVGYPCPLNMSLADFCVDVSSIDPRTKEMEDADRKRVDSMVLAFAEHQQSTQKALQAAVAAGGGPSDVPSAIKAEKGRRVGPQVPWVRQVATLTSRFLRNMSRDKGNVQGGLLQALVLGLVIMAIFWNLPSSLSGIRSRYGLMYVTISSEPYILLIILVQRFCTEMKVFDRERQDGMYSPSAYLVAHFLSSLPIYLVQPLFFALPIYLGAKLRLSGGDARHLVTYCGVNIMLTLVTSGLAWFSVSINRAFAAASLIANTQYTFIGLTSGFLVTFSTLPVYVRWVRHISFQSYAYRLLMTNEFSGNVFDACPFGDPRTQAACVQYTGDFVLTTVDIKKNDYLEPWLVMTSIFLIYYLLALACLHFLDFAPSGVVGSATSTEPEAAKNAATADETQSADSVMKPPQPITISLHGLSLSVTLPSSVVTRAAPAGPPLKRVTSWERLQMTGALRSPTAGAGPTASFNDTSGEGHAPVPNGRCKKLLYDIHAEFMPGRVAALMGGSGCGKTTLLNLLAGRTPVGSRLLCSGGSAYEATGDVRYNGSVPSPTTVRQAVGYVQQQDFLLPSLSVRETLHFSALMRMPRGMAKQDKLAKVESTMQLLGLRQCRDTIVGSDDVKGISGGEKRRLSLALQMLLEPAVLLLDEPTSGLDTFTARHVMETLKALATRGRTVILSIHQPRSDVFALLDDVVLLSRGRLLWSGPSGGMLTHFEAQGFAVPPLTNPAEFILDVSSIDLRQEAAEAEGRARVTRLVQAFKDLQAARAQEEAQRQRGESEGAAAKVALLVGAEEAPLWWCLPLSLQRSCINLLRQPGVASARISQGLFFGLILACFYAPVGKDQDAVQNRMGLLYEVTPLCFIGMLNCIAVFPTERNVFYREYLDGGQSVSAFYLTYQLLCLPFVLVSGLLLSLLFTYVMGLAPTPTAFIGFAYVIACFIFTGECIGVAFCVVFFHLGFSVNVMSVVLSIFCIICGFIGLDMPLFIQKINYISPIKWGAWILANLAFEDVTFTCENKINGRCPIADGQQVIELYKMTDEQDGDMRLHLGVLTGVTCAYALLAYLVLRLRMNGFTGVQQ